MPFTLAHSAVAIPWASTLQRRSVLSALVIGSMVPDFAYFLPLAVSRAETHSFAGIVWFSLPLGLLIWWLFHALVKRSVAILLPYPLYARLDMLSRPQWQHGLSQWLSASIAVCVGAATHIVWDSFTHQGSPLVQGLPLLRWEILHLSGFHLPVYKLLQHGSTVIGSLLVVAYVGNWFRTTTKPHGCPPSPIRGDYRYLCIALLVLMPMAVGLLDGWNADAELLSLRWMRQFVGRAVVATVAASLWTVAALSIILTLYERLRVSRETQIQ